MEDCKKGHTFEFSSSPNIALIKYWGKLDDHFNLPLNSSVSLTLDKSNIRSRTKITEIVDSDKVIFTLNGESTEISKIHKKALEYFEQQCGNGKKRGILIESDNNFPTAAGMASSASGFAAFASCLAISMGHFKTGDDEELEDYFERKWIEFADALKNVKENTESFRTLVFEIGKIVGFTSMVRQLSGSACRSLFKGYSILRGPENLLRNESFLTSDLSKPTLRHVLTNFGITSPPYLNLDLPASILPAAPASTPDLFNSMLARHFSMGTPTSPDLRLQLHFACTAMPLSAIARFAGMPSTVADIAVTVVVMNSNKKIVGSKAGMIDSSKTSDFLIDRIDKLEAKIDACVDCIINNKIDDLLTLISRDSNSLHAVCMDTWPPIRYISDASFSLMSIIHSISASRSFGVSFDAGSNPFIFSKKSDLKILARFFMAGCKTDVQGLMEYAQTAADIGGADGETKIELSEMEKAVVGQIERVFFSVKHD